MPVAPWGMALDYTVCGATDAEANVPVAVTATANGTNYVARHLSGATNWVNGTHRVYWNMAKDGITATVADSVVTVVTAGSASVSNVAWRAHGESAPVTDALQIDYVPDGNGRAVVGIDGRMVVDSATSGTYMWRPQTTGTCSVVHSGWDGAFTATYTVKGDDRSALYRVVDLSGGTSATSYPISYLSAVPAGGWTDEYKTTKLVLRRVEAGTFIMGGGTTPESHRVTISQPFYVGVFEVTQKQWELVMGSNPSGYKGDARPVENVVYDDIRGSSAGAGWPSSSAVDATSFLGRLRAKTGLDGFDLPTEAQWEYACRAGTTSTYNNGGSTTNDLKTLGRYSGNTSDGRGGYTSAHTTVGSYLPNAWGLYDMHGNVWEWCLDWHNYSLSYGIDPVGASSGSYRAGRGGNWSDSADDCASSHRYSRRPSDANYFDGCRLVCPLSDDWEPADDTPSGGTWLFPSATVQTHAPHDLDADDRYDFFRISMTAGWTYTFETTGDGDTYGELFSAASTNASYRVASDDDGGDGSNFKLTYTPTTSGTYYLRVRAYSVGASLSYALAYGASNLTFVSGDVTATGWSGAYDGAAHGISVSVDSGIVGTTVAYATAQGGPYSSTPPTRTDAGAQTTWYVVSAPGYVPSTNAATVSISPRAVTLTSASASKEYDGAALVKCEVSVGGDGFVSGEGATYAFTGSQTAIGTSDNTFAYELDANTKASNYAITVDYGVLAVTDRTWTHAVNSDGTATLTGVSSARGDVAIPGEIDGCHVTALGDSLFSGCTGLKSVTLPSRVTTIGASAFAGCTGLDAIAIPSRVSSIGAGAFSGCTGLKSVTLPSRVTALAASLFSGCTGLETVTLRGAVTSIGERAFSGCARLTGFALPDTLETIGDFAFAGCNGLSAVTIPEGVADIGLSAFAGCGNVQSVVLETIPPVLEAMPPFVPGPELVDGSNWIEEPDSLEGAAVWRSNSIGDHGSTELAFDVPAGMEAFVFAWKVGSEANYDKLAWYLDGAKQADISGSQDWRTVTNVLDGAAHRVRFVYLKDGSVSTAPDCGWVSVRGSTGGGLRGLFPDSYANLTNVVLGANVTTLPAGLFAGCAGLDSITLPSAATVIAESLFSGCTGLQAVTIPSGVTSIGDSALAGCTGIRDFVLPEGVESIGTSAFAGCTRLAAVNFAGNAPADVDKGAFPTNAVLYVRHGSEGWGVMIPGTWHGCPIRYADGYRGFDLRVEGWSGIYDGKAHGVSVTVAGGVADVSLKYALSANGPFVSSVRTLTDAGAATVWCEISAPGYDTQTCSAEIAIARRVVALTSGSASKEYDGTALVKREVSVGGDGFASGEGASYSFTGSQTAVGTSDNAFTYELNADTRASNYDVTVDYGTLAVTGRTWTHAVNSDGTATLTGVSSAKGDVAVPGVVDGHRVTALGASLFKDCAGMTEVSIPSSVTSIPDDAFNGCSSLASITIPSRVTAVGARAFRGCAALKSLALPARVTRIEAKAFEGCTGLETVSIPSSVTFVASDAFSGCAAVRSVTVPARARILSTAFPDAWKAITNVVVAAGTTSIDGNAFSGCIGLASVSIPAGVTSVGADAFSGCTGLKSVAIPSGVAEIGEFAFSGCSGLVAIELPAGLAEIAPSVFQECAALASVVIPSGVETIGDYAFAGCTSLGAVEMPAALAVLGESAFESCSSLAMVAMPSGVDVIGAYAFYNCSGLERVVFAGDAPTDVGDWAFPSSATVYVPRGSTGWGVAVPGTWQDCPIRYAEGVAVVEGRHWAYVVLGDGTARVTGVSPADGDLAIPDVVDGWDVTGIEDWAFEGCDALASVSIPAGVEYVSGTAFAGCGALTDISVDADSEYYVSTTNGLLLTKDGRMLVRGAANRRSVSVPAGVREIGVCAFDGCAVLEALHIPAGVAGIGDYAFSGCGALTDVSVDAGSASFKFEGGLLLTKDGRMLVRGGAGLKSVSVPDGVTGILSDAFSGCGELQVVEIPSGVTGIGESAFDGCSGLREIVIGADVAEVFEDAFAGCESLEKVLFKGNAPAYLDGDGDPYESEEGDPMPLFADAPASCVVYVPRGSTGWGVSIPGTWQGLQIRYMPSLPAVEGDADATVTGDAAAGYVVTPGADNKDVTVTIPDGVSADKVTVVVGPDVATIRPNGAAVKVVRNGHDITAFLDVPSAVGGVVDLASATVKTEYVREPLDTTQGAVVDLSSSSSPSLTTAPTRKGLVYTLREGATLDAMKDGATTVGDGNPWTPTLTVKGGASGFYLIRVDK